MICLSFFHAISSKLCNENPGTLKEANLYVVSIAVFCSWRLKACLALQLGNTVFGNTTRANPIWRFCS